jgi:3'5'-cyclic nucleotide phosphodiesterase
VKEGTELAAAYQNKSVAEQRSVDLAWQTLMLPEFEDLRRAIYSNKREFELFRSVIVNAVVATDIVNKELGDLRKARWNKAFHGETIEEDSTTSLDRKTTIIIECIIQASDIAHTMQHWQIYRKWNARLYQEMFKAWKEGRADRNPAESWYKGELGFFDFYIIPLAKKLKDCRVFGVSSDECKYSTVSHMLWVCGRSAFHYYLL